MLLNPYRFGVTPLEAQMRAMLAGGVPGFIFDLADASTLFTSVALAPVVSAGDAIALMLDKSRDLARGVELIPALNFGSGWTNAGATLLNATSFSVADGAGRGFYSDVFTVGRVYEITINFTKDSNVEFRIANSTSSARTIATSGAGVTDGEFTATRWYASDTKLYFRLGATAGQITINSVTVKEITGNHAWQGTTTSRALWGGADGALDGVDDSWQLPAVDFSGTDAVTIFAKFKKESDATTACLLELGSTLSNNGTFAIFAPGANGATTYGFYSRGTATAVAQVNAVPAPNIAAFTGQGRISTDTCIARIGGVQVATSANDQGAGNYQNAVVNIGRRNNSQFPFKGRLHRLGAVGKLCSPAEILTGEAWLNELAWAP